MGIQILSPRSDFIFKRIFGNQANADILASFLRSVLKLPESEYETLTIVDPHLQRETPDGKMSILDVKLRTKSGNVINIEIQILDMPEMRERIVLHTSRMITDQISKGDKYGVIKKVISIVITNYVLISENEAYHNSYTLCDMKTGSEFTDVVEVDVLELPKLPPQGDGTALGDWLQFLKSGSEDDLTVIAQKSPELKKVVGILMDLSADERTRMLYEAHETARMDEESRMRGAWNKGRVEGEARGRVEGEARGRVEGKMEAARAMINDGLPLETVSRYTGIPADELRRHINGSGVKS